MLSLQTLQLGSQCLSGHRGGWRGKPMWFWLLKCSSSAPPTASTLSRPVCLRGTSRLVPGCHVPPLHLCQQMHMLFFLKQRSSNMSVRAGGLQASNAKAGCNDNGRHTACFQPCTWHPGTRQNLCLNHLLMLLAFHSQQGPATMTGQLQGLLAGGAGLLVAGQRAGMATGPPPFALPCAPLTGLPPCSASPLFKLHRS